MTSNQIFFFEKKKFFFRSPPQFLTKWSALVWRPRPLGHDDESNPSKIGNPAVDVNPFSGNFKLIIYNCLIFSGLFTQRIIKKRWQWSYFKIYVTFCIVTSIQQKIICEKMNYKDSNLEIDLDGSKHCVFLFPPTIRY